ncbi:hypothetical protein DKX38_018315 [Salix brachista]|uniref:Uncharacterized protein n=1 Tax=Salix brachista TaxID=2182728 RepID=A0A5N5KMP5_9ROSI|nr:hypothetical protein DKX38_018315 [Salix brachista]
MAVSLDPMFFYVPVIEDGKKCLSLDSTMEITASVLRSFTDIFYMLHIIFHFRTGFIPPSSRVFGRGVLVDDTWAIAKRYLSSYFLIDILSVLPLPQVVISSYLNTKNVLKFVVIFQYVPRFMRIYPLYMEVATSGILTETAWAGAAFNLFLYMLASHVIGAFWYLFSIERQTNCWRQACGTQDTCRREFLVCDGAGGAGNLSYLDNYCPITTPNETVFNFGIFLDALQSGVVLSSTGFSDKFSYCFWWGLRNLRYVDALYNWECSLGQNLKTSAYVWETCFAVFISISGLVLLMFVTGNFQTYLQSTTTTFQRRDEEILQNLPRDLSVSSNTSSPSETEIMEEANHAGEDQGNNDHAITINGGEDQGSIDHAIIINDGEDQGNEDHAITINGVTS